MLKKVIKRKNVLLKKEFPDEYYFVGDSLGIEDNELVKEIGEALYEIGKKVGEYIEYDIVIKCKN